MRGTSRAGREAALLGERADVAQEARECFGRADRIARDEQHTVLDPVGEERSAIAGEEVSGIPAQLEERERVPAVSSHERQHSPTALRLSKRLPSPTRPEENVRPADEPDKAHQAESERKPAEPFA